MIGPIELHVVAQKGDLLSALPVSKLGQHGWRTARQWNAQKRTATDDLSLVKRLALLWSKTATAAQRIVSGGARKWRPERRRRRG